MKIIVNSPFISKKTNFNWKEAGMTKDRYKGWFETLCKSLKEKEKHNDNWLKVSLVLGNPLKFKVVICGIPQRIKQLDIHDALAQIVDEITNCLFPRERGKPTPQTQDRHFWYVEGEKKVCNEERVEIEIEEFK